MNKGTAALFYLPQYGTEFAREAPPEYIFLGRGKAVSARCARGRDDIGRHGRL